MKGYSDDEINEKNICLKTNDEDLLITGRCRPGIVSEADLTWQQKDLTIDNEENNSILPIFQHNIWLL